MFVDTMGAISLFSPMECDIIVILWVILNDIIGVTVETVC